MVDRVIVYPGALPQDTDQLNTNLFALVGQSFQNSAMLGTTTVVAGLACLPTSPASLQVTVAPGSIYAIDNIDASPYGSLGTNLNSVMKQGILPATQTLTITPPGTVGFSQVYLIEAALADIDTGATVLSYFNSNNPQQPFSGPANSGSSNYTQRTCRCVIQLKAGVAAATGTQVTPSADVGFVGLYAVTVSNGTTQITAGLIAQLASAPFFPSLPQIPYGVQGGNYIYGGQDTGTANNYVVTFQPGQPIPLAYAVGLTVKFKALNSCSGASVVNVQGLGNVAIRRANGIALTTGDIVSGQVVELTYDGTVFQMANYLGTGANTNSNTVVGVPYVADTGTQNQIIATFSPAITSGQQIAGLVVTVKLANTITGACTINVNGLGVKAVTLGDLTNPPFGVFVAGMDLMLEYDGTEYQIVNTSAGMFYRRPTGNINIYVNASTGSDTLYDGTSATVTGVGTAGPLKTIGKGMLTAFGYAPSPFSIFIQVAAGTYNEAVATPTYAGPNVIINGVSAASVTINSGNAHTISVTGPNTLTSQNVTVQNNGANNWGGFVASSGAIHTANNCISNTIGGGVFYANGGTVNAQNHTFSGSCGFLYWGIDGGTVQLGTFTHTFTTPISVSSASAGATQNGTAGCTSAAFTTFVNPSFVSGPKYLASFNGVVVATGLGVNFYPGSLAGSTNTGGQYSP